MKDIKGYEGLYAITSCGKVWSYKRKSFMIPQNVNGYQQVGLRKDGKRIFYYIHRLVAEAYIPNPNNLAEVNHKDENKAHNYAGNLEWVSHKENCNYGTRNIRTAKKTGKPIYCVELDKIFYSQGEAARELGLSQGNISSCLSGKVKTCGGYHWRYADEK